MRKELTVNKKKVKLLKTALKEERSGKEKLEKDLIKAKEKIA